MIINIFVLKGKWENRYDAFLFLFGVYVDWLQSRCIRYGSIYYLIVVIKASVDERDGSVEEC